MKKSYKFIRNHRSRSGLICLIALVMAASLHQQAVAAHNVNSNLDMGDSFDQDGFCDTAHHPPSGTPRSGVCTLRAAIQQANHNRVAGGDSIFINVTEIQPRNPLPYIRVPITISPGAVMGTRRVVLNGFQAGNNANGLVVTGGDSTIRRLVIKRFKKHGIILWGGGNNRVRSCLIGTDSTGHSATQGNEGTGVLIYNSPNNTIGGLDIRYRNIISANHGHGVYIGGSGSRNNEVFRNYIGTNIDGDRDIGNRRIGVFITDSDENKIGSRDNRSQNLISGNDSHGVVIQRSNESKVQNNLIGTHHNGREGIGNGGIGVFLARTSSCTVGGVVPFTRNIISSNTSHGVMIQNGRYNHVEGNRIGTTSDGNSDMGNSRLGVALYNSHYNTIGSIVNPARNIISGNNRSGITVWGRSTNNTILNNFVGTNINGTRRLGNDAVGILIHNSAFNTIGGTGSSHYRNVISGNARSGLQIQGRSEENTILGNKIGTNRNGDAGISNGSLGIFIHDSSSNTIGGDQNRERNIISSNSMSGIMIFGSAAEGNVVQGNYIGTNEAGSSDLGNGNCGATIMGAPNNTIGGDGPRQGNVISGNYGCGSTIQGSIEAKGNTILGNLIGTDATGLNRLGNQFDGVYIRDVPDNTIGGTTAGAKNVIADNEDGITISRRNATGNKVQGNLIGTKKNGTDPLPNRDDGILVFLSASDNRIGGATTDEGNTIAFNPGVGVKIRGSNSRGNSILSNRIYDNDELGIDLDRSGVTGNDQDDSDLGANEKQNFPLLLSDLSGRTIDVMLQSDVNQDYHIQIFNNDDHDPTRYGEGKDLIAEKTVRTDNEGRVTATLAPTAVPGRILTATARHERTKNSSEFSCMSGLVDLDVDSDNTSDLAGFAPQRVSDEDTIETDDGKPGRILIVNDDDNDGDDVPDYFDGFDMDGSGGSSDDDTAGENNLIKMVLELSPHLDLSRTIIRFSYDASDPADATISGNPQVRTLAPGHLRIWKSSTSRNNIPINQTSGTFVGPRTYLPGHLGIDNANRTVSLWLEAVRKSSSPGSDLILVEVNKDGFLNLAGFGCADAVRVTAAKLKIARMRGLYKEDSSYEPDYIGADGQGKIYVNRVYDPADPANTAWTRNKQYVDIRAELDPSGILNQQSARIVWEIADPDDTSNRRPASNNAYNVLMDPNDYDGNNNDGIGGADDEDGKDNNGNLDSPHFFENLPGYAIFDQRSDLESGTSGYVNRGSAETSIVAGASEVRLNVQDNGGDNYTVKLKLKWSSSGRTQSEVRIGTMTVWKKIDLEYVQMASARTLPVDDLPDQFKIAYVDMEVKERRAVPDFIVGGLKVMGASEAVARPNVFNYVTSTGGQFSRQGPGWFFIAAANEFTPVIGRTTPQNIFPRTGTTQDATALGNIIRISTTPDMRFGRPEAIRIYNAAETDYVIFEFNGARMVAGGTVTEIRIRRKNYQPITMPNISDAFLLADLDSYGFTRGSAIKVVVKSTGSRGVGGTSPGQAGKLLIFTVQAKPANDLRFMVHEMTHAFGMAHLCGNWDHKDVTPRTSCAMNYDHWFMLDDASPRVPIPWTHNKMSVTLCPAHIKAIRDSNLEDHPALGW